MLLLIDNYDSFSHNLARYFVELGCELKVVRNDEVSLEDIAAMSLDGIVISPGPCTPDDAGISLAVIEHFAGKLPLLGVCLGHQAMGQVFGAQVCGAQHIRHGKLSPVSHTGHPLFKNVPVQFTVTRYHSLVLSPENLPDCLEVLAWSQDGSEPEVMAIAHRHLPVWGLQYHPESLLTEFGHQVLANFIALGNIPVPHEARCSTEQP